MRGNGKLTSYAILEKWNGSAGVEAGGLVGDAVRKGARHVEEVGHRWWSVNENG